MVKRRSAQGLWKAELREVGFMVFNLLFTPFTSSSMIGRETLYPNHGFVCAKVGAGGTAVLYRVEGVSYNIET